MSHDYKSVEISKYDVGDKCLTDNEVRELLFTLLSHLNLRAFKTTDEYGYLISFEIEEEST